jgi:hypothetical protein
MGLGRHQPRAPGGGGQEAARENVHRLPYTPEQRQQAAAMMRAEGMSYRQIAERLKVDKQTVANDLKASGVENSTPDPPPVVTGRDGKQYPASRPAPLAGPGVPVAGQAPPAVAARPDANAAGRRPDAATGLLAPRRAI